jgi:polysaccharide biosynthesis protein PslG
MLAAAVLITAAPACAQDPPPAEEPAVEQCPVQQSEGNGLFVGIVSDQLFADETPEYRRCTLNTHAEIGIRIIRQSLRWDQIEKKKGQYDFARWDQYVLDTARHGVHVMPIIQDAPRWRQQSRRSARFGLNPPKRAAAANFAARLVRRYGPDGQLWRWNPNAPKLPIQVWQIWNEPNLPRYWQPRPNAAEYVKLLWAVSNAIRDADPDAEIVTAGLPDSRLRGVIPLYQYVTEMYEAGAEGAFDAIAVNAYAETPKLMFKNLGKVRAIMRYFQDPAKIWITELGWGTGGPRYRFRVSRSRQAEYVGRALRGLEERRFKLGLRGFVHYQWQDAPPYGEAGDFWGLHTGLLDMEGDEKPVFNVFRRIGQRLRWIR